jgi:bacillolysin
MSHSAVQFSHRSSLLWVSAVAVVTIGSSFTSNAYAESHPTQPVTFNGPLLSRARKAAEILKNLKENPQIQSKLEQNGSDLRFHKVEEAEGMETYRFKQTYQGIEVFGAQALHHEGETGDEVTDWLKSFDVQTQPTLSSEQAVAIAQALVGDRALISAPKLKIYPMDENRVFLTYWMDFQASGIQEERRVILDAHSGAILGNISAHLTIAPIHVLTTTGAQTVLLDEAAIQKIEAEQDRFVPPANWNTACQIVNGADGSPRHINLSKCQKSVVAGKLSESADSDARDALSNAQRTRDYYWNTHRRDSFDGRGAQLVNLIHVGEKFSNAFWNGFQKYMGYGDGDGVRFGSFTRAVDVAGHEMTHGVVGETAELIPLGEPGALNEAYSDFFGLIIAGSKTWDLGMELALDPAKTRPIRSLSNPSRLLARVTQNELTGEMIKQYYPAHMKDMLPYNPRQCDEENDMCWVHLNATIPGHAMYKMFKTLGQSKAEKLQYRVLTQFLPENPTFRGWAQVNRKACPMVLSPTDCDTVDEILTSVGLGRILPAPGPRL